MCYAYIYITYRMRTAYNMFYGLWAVMKDGEKAFLFFIPW